MFGNPEIPQPPKIHTKIGSYGQQQTTKPKVAEGRPEKLGGSWTKWTFIYHVG
jgi:hypothetical protein